MPTARYSERMLITPIPMPTSDAGDSANGSAAPLASSRQIWKVSSSGPGSCAQNTASPSTPTPRSSVATAIAWMAPPCLETRFRPRSALMKNSSRSESAMRYVTA